MPCIKTLILTSMAIISASMPVIASAESLCSANEKPLFECKFEHSSKSVSLCQSKDDPLNISYRFGTLKKIEISLPNERSGKPYVHFEKFGPGSFQWTQSINFPVGKVIYSMSTPQGISAGLTVEGIKKPLYMGCGTGDSGPELSNVYEEMEKLKFKRK